MLCVLPLLSRLPISVHLNNVPILDVVTNCDCVSPLPRLTSYNKFTVLSAAARWPAVRDERRPTVLSSVLRRLLRRVLRQLWRADRRRPRPNVARGSALARDRGLFLLRDLPRLPPGSAVPAATWCHLLQHSVQQGGTADDTERLLRRAAAAPAVFSQVSTASSHTSSPR